MLLLLLLLQSLKLIIYSINYTLCKNVQKKHCLYKIRIGFNIFSRTQLIYFKIYYLFLLLNYLLLWHYNFINLPNY